jgi:hypothetical protein
LITFFFLGLALGLSEIQVLNGRFGPYIWNGKKKGKGQKNITIKKVFGDKEPTTVRGILNNSSASSSLMVSMSNEPLSEAKKPTLALLFRTVDLLVLKKLLNYFAIQ